MRWTFVWVTLILAAIPVVGAQVPGGAGCVPVSPDRPTDLDVGFIEGLVVDGTSQRVDVRWDAVAAAVGYRVTVFEDGAATIRETSEPACSFGAVNGRLYAITVQAIGSDGALGPASDPVAVRPALPGDMVVLALGLAAVWAGVWGYAFVLGRQQRRVRARYEALFKAPPPDDGT